LDELLKGDTGYFPKIYNVFKNYVVLLFSYF